jgi:hypothetical protein
MWASRPPTIGAEAWLPATRCWLPPTRLAQRIQGGVLGFGAPLDEILRAKPSSSTGRYLKKVVVSMTTGPGIPVDPAVTRNFTEA